MNQRPLRREARPCHYSAISGAGTSLLYHQVKESPPPNGVLTALHSLDWTTPKRRTLRPRLITIDKCASSVGGLAQKL